MKANFETRSYKWLRSLEFKKIIKFECFIIYELIIDYKTDLINVFFIKLALKN